MKSHGSQLSYKTLNESGNTIIIVLFTMALLAVLAGAVSQMVSRNALNRQRTLLKMQAQGLAEGCIEVAYAQWRRYVGQKVVDVSVGSESADLVSNKDLRFIRENPPAPLGGVPGHPTLSQFFGGFTLTRFEVLAVDEDGEEITEENATPEGVEVAEGGGVNNLIFRYRAFANVQVNNPPGGVPLEARVTRDFEIFKASNYSEFSYSTISDPLNPLEIHPGPRMDITGPIFVNNKIYYGHTSLWFHDRVVAAGDAYNKYFERSNRAHLTPGPANFVSNATSGPQTNVANRELLGESEDTLISAYPNNPNASGGLRELIETPVAGHEDPLKFAKRRLSNNAEVQIFINSSLDPTNPDRVKVFVRDGVDENGIPTHKAAPGPIREAVLKGLGYKDNNGNYIPNTNGGVTIRDNRETNNVFLTNVDVEKLTQGLLDAQAPSGKTGMGIYIKDVSVSDTNPAAPAPTRIYNPTTQKYETQHLKKAVKLYNGDTFPAYNNIYGDRLGFSFSSQNAIYVQGDFNTGGSPPANAGANNMPSYSDVQNQTPAYESFSTVNGYQRAPAMVAGDAVMILSNAWDDSKSNTSMSSTPGGNRNARNTTMNMAIVSGNVQAGPSGYSGGLENFPRFLEFWDDSDHFNFYGTMILGYKSGQFTGTWGKSNVYDPPIRRWLFEAKLRSATGLPEDFLIEASLGFRRGRVLYPEIPAS